MSDHEQKDESRAFHFEAGRPIFEKAKGQEEATNETRAREQHEFAREQVKINKKQNLFTALLVMGTFFGTGIGIWQGSISQTAANAARDAASTASDAVAEARYTRQNASRDAQRARELNSVAREASEKQSRDSLDASIEASRLDQRAWVGPKMVVSGLKPFDSNPVPNLVIGQKILLGVILINSGKTPALHFTGWTDIGILPTTANFSPKYRPEREAWKRQRGVVAMMPGGTLAMMAPESDEIVSQAMIDNLKAERMTLYLFGSYTYSDVFGKEHFTKFCMFATPELTAMGACKTYGDQN